MIVIKELPNKKFSSKSELINYLKINKEELLNLKKIEPVKYADAFYCYSEINVKESATKQENNSNLNPDTISVKLVLNTTNWIDSHLDLHVPGLWKKTIKDHRNGFFLLQEHQSTFDHVIARNAKASTQNLSWKELGVNIEGETEALIFETEIKKEDNPFMFEQYRKGYVNNHSVGMQYVKIEIAIFDEDDEKEMDFWNKYYPMIANKERADDLGFFWVVTEAKLREGSAVLFGSNPITPTLEVKTEPSPDTQSNIDTQKTEPSEELTEAQIKESLTIKII